MVQKDPVQGSAHLWYTQSLWCFHWYCLIFLITLFDSLVVFRGLGGCSRELRGTGAVFPASISAILTYSLFSVSSKNNDYVDEVSWHSNDITCGDVGLVSGICPALTSRCSALRWSQLACCWANEDLSRSPARLTGASFLVEQGLHSHHLWVHRKSCPSSQPSNTYITSACS